MQDLHFATNDIYIAPCLANLALKGTDGLMKRSIHKKGGASGAMPPNPLSLKTPGGGGAGGVSHTRTGPGHPPMR